MSTPIERATAYLSKLEADRKAATELSKEKAEEAKLIKARQEGFREALEMLQVKIWSGEADATPNKRNRAKRRNIPELILNELSFSGKAMTANQIARAIDYLPDRTEEVLKRMANAGQIMQTVEGRWITVTTGLAQRNGHITATVGGKLPPATEAALACA
jgi:hypothetical protein